MNIVRFARVATLAGLGLAGLSSAAFAQKKVKPQRDKIVREEILASPFVDLDIYQVIRGLRPHFLETPKSPRSVGAGEYAQIAVFLDERTQLDVNALRTMSPRTIGEVRYFNSQQSMSRFGPKVNGGAILVTTFKGPPVDTTSRR